MDKKMILKSAVGNLRKELRTHGGKQLFPEQKPAAPAAVVVEDDEPDELEKKK